MKEIPILYVRINQWGIVTFVLLSLLLQFPWLIVGLWLIEGAGFIWGLKGNLFIRLIKPIFSKKVLKGKTEAAELQKFNNGIAVSLLTFSVLFFALGWTIPGYIAALFVATAAFIAICGFCIGCVIYFQFKQWKARRSSTILNEKADS